VAQVDKSHLDQALRDYSGYIAVDELYDESHGIVSIVDNRKFQRLMCRVLGEKVDQSDILELLKQFKQELDQRKLPLAGITTDGSNLYPAAIKEVFGEVPHQVCRFHVAAMIAKAAREAVVKLYKQRVASLPKLKGGRPRRDEQERAQQVREQKEQLLKLYRSRYTLVARTPDPQKLKEAMELLKPYPEIASIRDIMQQYYGLYSCPDTLAALAKLTGIRQQAAQLQDHKLPGPLLSALNGPCIEKSLVFLDHPDLPSTSNAVERSNRRYRKMQKNIYRVRSTRQIERRLAMDLLREERAMGREECLMALTEHRQAA
jgi:hypothetical protein